VDRRDGGHRHAMDDLEDAVEGGDHLVHHLWPVVGHLHAGAPAGAVGRQDHALERTVVGQGLQLAVEFVHHLDVEHVVFGPVEGQGGDAVDDFMVDEWMVCLYRIGFEDIRRRRAISYSFIDERVT
jgi:hypothetical protein